MKVAAHKTSEARLEQVRAYLRDYPTSVVAVSYAGDAPPLVLLGTLVTSAELGGDTALDPVLARFVKRLRGARPDLTREALLQLPVPASAGDQEVYTARLGKWLFEKGMLERALNSQRRG